MGQTGSVPYTSPGQALALMSISSISGSSFATPEEQGKQLESKNPLQSFATAQSISALDNIEKACMRSAYELDIVNGKAPTADPARANEMISLMQAYMALLTEVQKYKVAAPSLNPNVLNAQIVKFRETLIDLDNKKANYILIPGSLSALTRQAFEYYLINILYIIGPILAIILITNTFYNKHNAILPVNLSFKLFYAFWAFLWYPIVLLYGCIDPPVWRSWLMPLVETNELTFFNSLFCFNPRVTNIIIIEKGRTMLRIFSMLLFSAFLYAYFFYDV